MSPLTSTSVGVLKPNIVTTQLKANATIEAAHKYLPTSIAMVVMDPYESKALIMLEFLQKPRHIS